VLPYKIVAKHGKILKNFFENFFSKKNFENFFQNFFSIKNFFQKFFSKIFFKNFFQIFFQNFFQNPFDFEKSYLPGNVEISDKFRNSAFK